MKYNEKRIDYPELFTPASPTGFTLRWKKDKAMFFELVVALMMDMPFSNGERKALDKDIADQMCAIFGIEDHPKSYTMKQHILERKEVSPYMDSLVALLKKRSL